MSNTDGVPVEVYAALYAIFHLDFKQDGRTFKGLPVWWDRTILPGERYEEGFFHLVTKGPPGCRNFDPRRAERLPWCGPIVSNCGDPQVKVWDYREDNGRIHTYVWLEALDYVVILHKRKQRVGDIAFLVTAYHVDGNATRRNLSQKHQRREP